MRTRICWEIVSSRERAYPLVVGKDGGRDPDNQYLASPGKKNDQMSAGGLEIPSVKLVSGVIFGEEAKG